MYDKMKKARMIGNYVQYLSKENGLSTEALSNLLNCTEEQVLMFEKGRAFLGFDQIKAISDYFHVSVTDLLNGNPDVYDATVVHCINDFQTDSNREKIMDIIDDYMDIRDAVESLLDVDNADPAVVKGENMNNTIVIQTCPKCGADLEHIVFATYPPIPAWICPKCGWRYEQQLKIERVPFEPLKEET